MAYNYFPTNYQPAYYPQAQQNTAQQPVAQSLIWVQGEAGAKSYLVAPNTTVTLWDSESQTVYIKSADAMGMPSIKTLDYTIREDVSQMAKIPSQSGFATKDDLDSVREELMALKAKLEGGSKK